MNIDLWQLTIYQAARLKEVGEEMFKKYGWESMFDFWNGGYEDSLLFWGEPDSSQKSC